MLICYGPLWNNWNRKVESGWEVGTKTPLATQIIPLKFIFSKSMKNTRKAIPTWLPKSKLGFLHLPRPQGPPGHLEVSKQKLYDQTAKKKVFLPTVWFHHLNIPQASCSTQMPALKQYWYMPSQTKTHIRFPCEVLTQDKSNKARYWQFIKAKYPPHHTVKPSPIICKVCYGYFQFTSWPVQYFHTTFHPLFTETQHFKIDRVEACMDKRCQPFMYEVSQ
jgi:hypothetical protein